MKISTGKTGEIPRGKSSMHVRRHIQGRRKAQQKVRKVRISGRRILSTLRILGKVAGISVIASAILFIGESVYHSEIFQVQNIAIYGCKEVDPAMLERIVRDNARGNILDVELDRLKEKLEEVKWIRQVEIRRVLPSGLVILVRERIPSVILEIEGHLMIADEEGVLLDKYTPQYGKLDVPVFRGVVGKDPAAYSSYQALNSTNIRRALDILSEIESAAPQYARKISEVDIADPDNLKIMLVDDATEIYLGKEDYVKRFCALMTSSQYQEYKRKNVDIATVDLRFKGIIYCFNRPVAGSPGKGNNE
jgi:cell division protein FtsQ